MYYPSYMTVDQTTLETVHLEDEPRAAVEPADAAPPPHPADPDPLETAEWLASLEAVHQQSGQRRVQFLLDQLHRWAFKRQVPIPLAATTPYINTIPAAQQPPFPGDREIERRIKSYTRWNAMAMVVRANRQSEGIGGHISSYASLATLLEVGFNHFFRAKTDNSSGDQIYFQGHSAPGIYARAYLERRIDEPLLMNFRRELAPGGGLASYPHPWLMPDFWEFPSVSMGLAPINSIYQARFNRYLRGSGHPATPDDSARVVPFMGDGEIGRAGERSEPSTVAGARAPRQPHLFVINCNLQRLDGPVRGNGKHHPGTGRPSSAARAGTSSRSCGGSEWDPLLASRYRGRAHRGRMTSGRGRRSTRSYSVESGEYVRRDVSSGCDPRLLQPWWSTLQR